MLLTNAAQMKRTHSNAWKYIQNTVSRDEDRDNNVSVCNRRLTFFSVNVHCCIFSYYDSGESVLFCIYLFSA